MATPANPVAGTLARGIIDQLVGGGRAGAPIPQPSGVQQPEMARSMLSTQLSELRQADPKAIQRMLTDIKKMIVQIIPQAAFTIPEMNKHLPNLLKTVDSALQAVEKATNTMAAVEGSAGAGGPGGAPGVNPIQSSIANPSVGVGQQPAAGTFPF